MINKENVISLPQAIIFDIDGTMADNERDGHRVAFNQAFKAAGLDWVWSEEDYGKLIEVGGGKERIYHYIATTPQVQGSLPIEVMSEGKPSETRLELGLTLGEGLGTNWGDNTALSRWIQQLHAAKTAFYRRLMAEQKIPLRPGVLRLLRECRQAGVRLAIATTSALPNALAVLETIAPDAPNWFEVIAAGDVVAAKKPAPDIYQYALHQLQLPPECCWAIEDSSVGLRAAIAAGLPTLITVNDYTQHSDFADARLVLSDLGEPDRPFRVLGGTGVAQMGDGSNYRQVDLSLLRAIDQASTSFTPQ